MTSDEIGHVLYDAQLDYDVIPQDVFAEPEAFSTKIGDGMLHVNTQEYPALIVPGMPYLTKATAEALCGMDAKGIAVLFAGCRPKGIIDADAPELEKKLSEVGRCVSLTELPDILETYREVRIEPANDRIRVMRYEQPDSNAVYMIVNEGAEAYSGVIGFTGHDMEGGFVGVYDAWSNELSSADASGGTVSFSLDPSKSLILVPSDEASLAGVKAYSPDESLCVSAEKAGFDGEWKRSICRSIEYPKFRDGKTVSIPDELEKEEPEFSGFARYENTFEATEGDAFMLEITDAYEGVEVFINGESLGIQIVPLFRYLLKDCIKTGRNELVIEVATTLSREMAKFPNSFGQIVESHAKSGITGEISLYRL